MRKQKGTQFNCFSPPIMVATLLIETILAVYVLWRYRLTLLTKLAVAMLAGLATFQLAEYYVCTGSTHAVPWSRVGFVAITTLPPLGLHIMHVLAKKPAGNLVRGAYLSMAGFIGFFLASGTAFAGQQCTGNYAIFQFSENVTGAYSLYYYSWLLVGITFGLRWAAELKAKGAGAVKRLQAVQGLVMGYFVFLVPTALANTIKPETRAGIPSIMCGFAVLLALILALYIMPRVAKVRQAEPLKLDKVK